MKIIVNKETKKLLLAVVLILLFVIVSGQLAAKLIADDYKEKMVEHDYILAGYLLEMGVEPYKIAKAFTGEKTGIEAQKGSELLLKAGYTTCAQTFLFPEVQSFQQKHAINFFVVSFLFSLIVLSILLLFLLNLNKKIDKANEDIKAFMDGDVSVRLTDKSEGSLSRLFESVNGMATSLTAHIDNEKRGREFLKDTISDISHQLKTPLTALNMYNEIIQNEHIENEVVNEFVSKSQRELNRMEVLIQNLLKLAKLDAGTIELEKGKHDVKEFLDDVVKSFATRAESEDKTIRLDCDENIMMDFDKVWLMEAVGNIIKNALDHTNANDEIIIRCEETPVLTAITVTDDGTGIHNEDIHHIFKRFYRSRFSKDKQGVGIGLTLSKAIVEKHGGTITVESSMGKGTVFRLAFPKLTNL